MEYSAATQPFSDIAPLLFALANWQQKMTLLINEIFTIHTFPSHVCAYNAPWYVDIVCMVVSACCCQRSFHRLILWESWRYGSVVHS